jgi:hypothetical protein
VISPGEGLLVLDEPVALDRLRGWASVPIDAGNRHFTEPLVRHAEDLERAYGATARFVLLGSVATDKYVRPLVRVFGDHLLFPSDFVGRGAQHEGAAAHVAAAPSCCAPRATVTSWRTLRSKAARAAVPARPASPLPDSDAARSPPKANWTLPREVAHLQRTLHVTREYCRPL